MDDLGFGMGIKFSREQGTGFLKMACSPTPNPRVRQDCQTNWCHQILSTGFAFHVVEASSVSFKCCVFNFPCSIKKCLKSCFFYSVYHLLYEAHVWPPCYFIAACLPPGNWQFMPMRFSMGDIPFLILLLALK